jgi:tetratricopeptide (TPR) repeat protein
MIEHQSGGYQSAVDCLRRAAKALGKHPLNSRPGTVIPTPAIVLGRLGWCLAELGEFHEAMASSEEAVELARVGDHPASLVSSDRSVGIVSLLRGNVPRAIPPLERAVEVCRITPLLILFDITAGHLGYAYALSGRLSEAVALLEEALAHSVTTGTADHALLLAYLGEARLLSGHCDAALAVTQRALDLARRQRERGNEAWVLRLLGEIPAQADPPDLTAAQEHYGQALARADELGMRPLVAHCHLGLGKLYRRTGDRAKAEEYLTTATTMYREMDMDFWLEKADAELGGVDR